MIEKLEKLSVLLHRHWLSFVILLVFGWSIALGLTWGSWFIAFWGNTFRGWHAQLDSCLQGIQIIISGFAGLMALGAAAWAKDYVYSKFNTLANEAPFQSPKPQPQEKAKEVE